MARVPVGIGRVRREEPELHGVERGAGGTGAPLRSASYRGQVGPGDGWSIRSATGGVFTGTKYDA
jgi:hypothetical protein